MSAVSKPGLKPTKSAIPVGGKTPVETAAVTATGNLSADAVEPKKSKTAVSGANKTTSATTLKGIAESFPVQALSKLEAKGIEGQTFLLDGGSLRGLKLEARRVKDGETAGFEIVFQLTPSKLGPLLEAMKKQEAKAGPLEFRELTVGDDGVATYGKARSKITGSTHRAPTDTDGNDGQWVLTLDGTKGGQIEVVHDKASLAVRGLVRINLRGDDATCTKQLDGLIKGLGLASLFAPPTPKSKQINALMRVLWQVDNAKATELSKGELDKLKVEDLVSALEGAGFTKERIDGLRYEEVYQGHFTIVDPAQAEAMVQAGARYLYSTVKEPAHVHSILLHGQKSSLERYKDGLIIEGMSTNSDFATGGAVGVFTRLVTQNAIYEGKQWTGRTYKLLQTHEQLGRTDFYGWNGDYFGRRWDLDSKINFGLGLLQSVDAPGNYSSSNELIFTAGNRPENIQRVIATTEDARKTLIAYLAKQGYEPHNGLSLEEFVVLSPKFLPFGKSPYDASDPEKFVAEAKSQAAEGKLSPLMWFLIEGPEAPAVRQQLETEILLGTDTKLHDAFFNAAKIRGGISLGEKLDHVLTELDSRGAAGTGIINRLLRDAAESLFCSGSTKAVDLLVAKKSSSGSGYQPFGLDDETFARIIKKTATTPGEAAKRAFDLAIELRAPSLLSDRHAGFLAFLTTNPIVKPEDPAAFIAQEIEKLKQNQDSLQLQLYAAQNLGPAQRKLVETELIRADHPKAVAILKTLIARDDRLTLNGDTLKEILDGMDPSSQTRKHLLGQAQDALLKLGHQGLFDLVVAHNGGTPDLNIYPDSKWTKVAEALLPEPGTPVTLLTRQILEAGSSSLVSSSEFLKRLSTTQGLYDLTDPDAFFADALGNLAGRGQLQFAYLFLGPEELAPHRFEGVKRLVQSEDYSASSVLTRATSGTETKALPLSPSQRAQMVEELSTLSSKDAMFRYLKVDGRQVLAEATASLLPFLDESLKGETNPLSRFNLSGNTLTEALEQARAREDADGSSVHGWLLKKGGFYLVERNDAGFVGHLQAIKATLDQVGVEASAAATAIKKAVDDNNYYYTSPSYESSAPYDELPVGAKWLLMQGEPGPDEKVLEAIESALPGWKWDEPRLAALMKRIPELSDEWKARLEAARIKT